VLAQLLCIFSPSGHALVGPDRYLPYFLSAPALRQSFAYFPGSSGLSEHTARFVGLKERGYQVPRQSIYLPRIW